ncbi:unnamed protein product [Aureobasidium pullulans]|nr:unnamed protein product [Aureobasidium pullulans]
MYLLHTLPLLASWVAYAAGSAAMKRQASSTSSAAGSATTLTPDDADTECTNGPTAVHVGYEHSVSLEWTS